MFYVLTWPYDFQKKFGTEWSTSPKIPNFQNGGKSPRSHFHMWGQNANVYNLYVVEKEISSGLILS